MYSVRTMRIVESIMCIVCALCV